MKKIGKLSINPEKVMKNDELVNLRGGYEGCDVCDSYIIARCGNAQEWIGHCFDTPFTNNPSNTQAALSWAASICSPEVVTVGPTCPGPGGY